MVAPSHADYSEELDAKCERVILQFERLKNMSCLEDIEPWLADIPTEKKDALVCELARICLERSFHELPIDATSPFLQYFAETFAKERWRSELAFEHYRLARQNNHEISTRRIVELYSLSQWQWGELPSPSTESYEDEIGGNRKASFPKPGEVFCGYPIVAKLGRGAMARVYLAKQPDLAERLVVLKVTDRFTTESDKLAKLQHSNIVPVYSIHRSENLYCICMPFLGSLTVADMLTHNHRENGSQVPLEQFISTVVSNRLSTITFADSFDSTEQVPANSEMVSSARINLEASQETAFSMLGIEELSSSLTRFVRTQSEIDIAVSIIAGVVDGMAYSHSNKIAHCDLKPENVLIANDGRPVILDFNLANRSLDTMPRLVGGTLPYMSPQQILSIEPGTPGSPSDDVFAIGVMLYQLLTGHLPFPTDKSTSRDWKRLAKEREELPMPPSRWVEGIPPSLESVVLKCLSADVAQRYPSAGELQTDLIRYRNHEVLRYAPDRSIRERMHKWMRRNPTLVSSSFLWTLAAVLTTLLLGTSLWNWRRIERLDASLLAQEMESTMPEVIAMLHSPNRDEQLLKVGVAEGNKVLKRWDILELRSSSSDKKLNLLSPAQQAKTRKELAYLSYAMASAEANIATIDADDRDHHFETASNWNRIAGRLNPKLDAALRFQLSRIDSIRSGVIRFSEPNKKMRAENSDDENRDDNPLGQMLAAQERRDLSNWRKWAEKMVCDNPSDPTAWFNLGSACYSLGLFAKSGSCYDVASKLQPKAVQSVFWRGVCALQTGELASAYRDFTFCLDSNPQWISARFNRALVQQRQREFQKAIADLDELDRQGNASTRIWVLRSQLCLALGKSEEAKSSRQSAIQAIPRDADDWTSLGLLQMPQNPEQSLESFRQALKIDPSNFGALQNSVHVLSEQLGRTEEAIEIVDSLVQLRPDQAGVYANRGILASRVGKLELAIADASRASQLSPTAIEQLQIAGIYAMCAEDAGLGKHAENAKESSSTRKAIALKWLARALTADPKLSAVAEQDSDLAGIRNEPTFRSLIDDGKGLVEWSR